MSVVFMGITLIIFIVYGMCAHGIRARLTRSDHTVRWIQRTFALMFGALGLKLALTEQ